MSKEQAHKYLEAAVKSNTAMDDLGTIAAALISIAASLAEEEDTVNYMKCRCGSTSFYRLINNSDIAVCSKCGRKFR